jgi:hypothetical protein
MKLSFPCFSTYSNFCNSNVMKPTCYDSYVVVFDKLCREFQSHMAKGSTSWKTTLMKKKGSIRNNVGYKRTIRLVIDEATIEVVVWKATKTWPNVSHCPSPCLNCLHHLQCLFLFFHLLTLNLHSLHHLVFFYAFIMFLLYMCRLYFLVFRISLYALNVLD